MNKNISNVCQKLLKYDRNIRSIRYHLNAIQNDIKLIEKGWIINYAIDFSVIYDYAYGLWDLIKSSKGNLDSNIVESFIQKTEGIKYLFSRKSENERLILLPPFAFELGHFINRHQASHILTEIQLLKFEEFIEENNKLFDPIKALYDFTKKNPHKKPSAKLIEKCLNTITTEFDDVFLVWLYHAERIKGKTISSERGLATIRALFDKDEDVSIEFIDELWPELTPSYKKLTEKHTTSSKWFSLFREARNRPNSDYVDTQAINLIYHLNDSLKKKKEIVFLVSDAPTMTRVLNWDLVGKKYSSIENPPRGVIVSPIEKNEGYLNELRVLRTPRTFLFHILCHDEKKEIFKKNLNTLQEYVENYFTLTSKIVGDIKKKCNPYNINDMECSKCEILETDDALNAILAEYQDINNKICNIQLCLNQSSDMGSHNGIISHEKIKDNIIDIVIDFVDKINTNYTSLKTELLNKKEQLQTKLKGLTNQIAPTAIKDSTIDEIQSFKVVIDEFSDIHDRVGFEDEKIVSVFKKIEKLDYKNPDAEQLRGYILKLVELSREDVKTTPEVVLLKASLAYLYKEYSYCIELLERHKRKSPITNQFGVEFLYTLTFFRYAESTGDILKIKQSIKNSKKIVAKYPANARSYHLFAFIISRAENTTSTRESFENVVKMLEKGLKLNPPLTIALSMLNNIAYIIYKHYIPDYKSTKKATNIVNKMKQLIPIEDWRPDYLDTAGCVFLLKAKQSSYFEEAKIEADLAIEYFDKAIELCHMTGRFRDVVDEIVKNKLDATNFLKKITEDR